jgi:hypothetical protein
VKTVQGRNREWLPTLRVGALRRVVRLEFLLLGCLLASYRSGQSEKAGGGGAGDGLKRKDVGLGRVMGGCLEVDGRQEERAVLGVLGVEVREWWWW